MPAKHFIIPLVIYPFDVLVSFDETDDSLLRTLKKYGNEPEDCHELVNMDYTVRGRCVMLPSNQTVIRIKRQPRTHMMVNIIAHEVFHAVTFILDRVGMKLLIGTSDEAYSYLVAYLTEEIFKRL